MKNISKSIQVTFILKNKYVHLSPKITVTIFCKYLGITPKEFFDYDNESPDTTRQLLEALTKIDKETLVHLTAIILALSKK